MGGSQSPNIVDHNQTTLSTDYLKDYITKIAESISKTENESFQEKITEDV